MNKIVVGAILGVLALVFLIGAAAASSHAAISYSLLGLAALSVIGIFVLLNKGAASPDAPAFEAHPDDEIADNPIKGDWDNWPKTLGVAGVGLVALLSFVGMFIAVHQGYGTWIIYPALAMVVIWLSVITLFTTGIVN